MVLGRGITTWPCSEVGRGAGGDISTSGTEYAELDGLCDGVGRGRDCFNGIGEPPSDGVADNELRRISLVGPDMGLEGFVNGVAEADPAPKTSSIGTFSPNVRCSLAIFRRLSLSVITGVFEGVDMDTDREW